MTDLERALRGLPDSTVLAVMEAVGQAIATARADAYAEARAWQPIETAPKDGQRKPLLLCVPRADGGESIVGEAYWNDSNDWQEGWWWAGTSPGEYADSPIHEINEAPTHWRPLPAPPSAP